MVCRALASHNLRTDHIVHTHARTTRASTPQHPAPAVTYPRRTLLSTALTLPVLATAGCASAAPPQQLLSVQAIEEEAARRYAARDFTGTLSLLDELVRRSPDSPRWREMRAQTLVDAKRFSESLVDYNAALQQSSELLDVARLLSGRALAHEGLAAWQSALDDYTNALQAAARADAQADPYVLNSRGNVLVSLARYAEARQDYLQSAELFQRAKGFRGANGSTTMRLDGSIYAFSNAAMMAMQLGDEAGALRELQGIARRAPGSVDVRAALAAVYWGQGQQEAAEAEWQFACDNISAGCIKYQDMDWLARIRRWPPVLVNKMADFVAFRLPEGAIQGTKPRLVEGL